MLKPPIKIAVIGVGYWGSKLVGEYLALSQKRRDVRFVAASDISKDRLSLVASRFNLSNRMLYMDYTTLLKDNSIDAVHIATPNETHFEIASKFLEAGKHVLLEKPMTLNSREAFKLARTAEELNLTLLVGHIFRFNNALEKARSLLTKGAIGEPYYAELRWKANLRPLPNRDILFDLAPHPIDITHYLFDDCPQIVSAVARGYIRKSEGLEEVAFINSLLPSGMIVHIALSWLSPKSKTRLVEVIGSKGVIQVDALNQKLRLFDAGGAKEIVIETNNTIESMIGHFVDRIVNGDPPRNSALVGAITVSVLEAISESVRSNGKPIRTRV